jgi:DNA-binding GntR family transcriptional regulator
MARKISVSALERLVGPGADKESDPDMPTTTRRSDGPLKDQAYTLIKERIIKLAYRPGAFLNEAQISEDLGIGRSPVHMAISRLALEDLVEIAPRKGVIVKPMSIDDFRSIYEARMLNEPAAAGLAAKRATEEDIRDLKALMREARAARKGDSDQLIAIDRAFHGAIADATKNRVLSQLLRTLHDRSLRQTYISWNYTSGLESDTLGEHKAVVDAIAARDSQEAERLMRAHLESSATGFDRMFERIAAAG